MNKLVEEIMVLEEKLLKLKCETTGKDINKYRHVLSKVETLMEKSEEELVNYRDNVQLALNSRAKYYGKKESK